MINMFRKYSFCNRLEKVFAKNYSAKLRKNLLPKVKNLLVILRISVIENFNSNNSLTRLTQCNNKIS
jgi:hypothetical protein